MSRVQFVAAILAVTSFGVAGQVRIEPIVQQWNIAPVTDTCTSDCQPQFFVPVDKSINDVLSKFGGRFHHATVVPGGRGAGEARQSFLMRNGSGALIVADDTVLDFLLQQDRLVSVDKGQPFDEIDGAFKRIDPKSPTRRVWIGVGWVAFSSLGKLHKAGECDALKWDQVCAERHDKNTYVVKQIEGHSGWPIVGVAVDSWNEVPKELLAARDAVVQQLTVGQFSQTASEYFLVPAATKIRTQRTVVFELWSPDQKRLIATTRGSTNHPMPVHAGLNDTQRSEAGGFNVCGGRQRACPPYKIKNDEARRISSTRKLEPSAKP